MARYATIDIGTNSVLLLVAERTGSGFEAVVDRAEITRLGRGVDRTGELAEEAMADTLAVLRRFAEEARAAGAEEIACTATSAARDAAGVNVEIISGDLEAELSYLAAAREVGTSEPLVVLDIGGGSTEVVIGAGGQVTYQRSFDVGSVRLTERFVRGDPPSLDERREMERLLDDAFLDLAPPPPGFRLVGIAGTVTTVCAVAHGVEPYDPKRIHLARLTAGEVRSESGRLFALPVEDRRRLPGMQPKRADVIPAGALILERAMIRLGAEEVIVSDRGVRWGLLEHRFGGRADQALGQPRESRQATRP